MSPSSHLRRDNTSAALCEAPCRHRFLRILLHLCTVVVLIYFYAYTYAKTILCWLPGAQFSSALRPLESIIITARYKIFVNAYFRYYFTRRSGSSSADEDATGSAHSRKDMIVVFLRVYGSPARSVLIISTFLLLIFGEAILFCRWNIWHSRVARFGHWHRLRFSRGWHFSFSPFSPPEARRSFRFTIAEDILNW